MRYGLIICFVISFLACSCWKERPILNTLTTPAPVEQAEKFEALEATTSLDLLPVTQLGADTIRVDLALVEGFHQFSPRRWARFPLEKEGPWANMWEQVTDIPLDLNKVTIRNVNMQLEQTVFHGWKSGMMEEDFALRWLGERDTTHLTPHFVDHSVSFLVGSDDAGALVVMFDADNDESFLGEQRFTYKDVWSSEQISADDRKVLPLVRVAYQYYDGQYIRNTEALLQADPYLQRKENPGIRLFFEQEQPPNMGVTLAQHRAGVLRTNDLSYQIRIHNGFANGVYWTERTRVQLRLISPIANEASSTVLYDVGDTVLIDTLAYKIDGVSLNGDELQLIKTDVTALRHTQLGGTPTEIVGNDFLTNTRVSLSSLTTQNKYVLIDFWGSWCPPCITELPRLKDAVSTYDPAKFAILGVALDEPTVLEHVLVEYEITWPQILQTSDNDSILEAYEIYQYPTLYLVSPENKIVAEGHVLRDSLEVVLDRYLLSE